MSVTWLLHHLDGLSAQQKKHTDNIEALFGLRFHPLAIDERMIAEYILVV